MLRLDRTHSSLAPEVGRGVHDAPLALTPGEPLTLTAFLDRSAVEAFANRRAALTGRIYPTRPDSIGVELLATGGSAHVRRCRVWRREAALADDQGSVDTVGSSLDHFIGSWTPEQTDEVNRALENFEAIDESMWS